MRLTVVRPAMRNPSGVGFLPAILAALPAVAGAVGAGSAAKAQADAQEDANKTQIELARQSRFASNVAAKQRAKWMPWAIAGGVVVVGLVAWAVSRRRSR